MRRAYTCRRNYAKVLKRIRNKDRSSKINVLFVVSDPVKWKCQKLYEAFMHDSRYSPIIGLSAWNVQSTMDDDELERHLTMAEAFFDMLEDVHVRTVRVHPRAYFELSEFSPDIVIYNEQWLPSWNQWPGPVSRFALTFFIPYYVPDYANIEIDCMQKVERYSFGYITLSEAWSNLYYPHFGRWTSSARFIACGHPSLDFFNGVVDLPVPHDGYVIYAPHFSIGYGGYKWHIMQGTFDWNGKAILQYAKDHPEIKWVFKPHPLFKKFLTKCGYMTENEISSYYSEWEEFACCCYTGDYQDLFLKSRAMITDCGSFLAEYGATGRPLIHLWSTLNSETPPQPSKRLWDEYYRVSNLDEMFDAFEMVLERNEDPKRESRLQAVMELQLGGTNASANILRYIRQITGR